MAKVKCIYCDKYPKEWTCTLNGLKNMYYYKCPKCGFKTEIRKTRKEAIKEWNEINAQRL